MSMEKSVLRLKHIVIGALAIFCAVAFGTLQSLDAVKLFVYLRANAHLRRILRSCLVANGVLFFSLWVASVFFSYIWDFGGGIMRGGGGGVGKAGSEQAAVTAGNVISLAGRVWFSVFDVTWVIPAYALTQAFGMRWYSSLYTEAYAEKKRRASPLGARGEAGEYVKDGEITSTVAPQGADGAFSFRTVVLSASEVMFKALVMAAYALLAAVVDAVIPSPVGNYLAFVMNSWLYSLYVFDYRLSTQYVVDRRSRRYTRVTLKETLIFFENHWAYFLGFGATQSIITAALRSSWLASSWFSSASVTSVLFGAHIVLSVEAMPSPRAPFPVLMFTPFFALCGMLLNVIGNALR
ncbi:hypothetical protein TraAM80_04117 [Trypanosoma rangeli]|uniref:Uncharacterized protein n=1 Tax=Trypanosoma rangeli TaxID=5698 RepID=A0A422NLB9_TRYRA|nr:uncharacterized protein TraAM80_04117 [Trypanosoma rangeli]RNF06139.1 hypothetical protein TraAM80_04117 [Trypanosoma rangeli]|eukprot:RNF06139.1 hypothetical protein TraAM80_04117 [Trypanosoma rangeli]